jgi:hypothetical protein
MREMMADHLGRNVGKPFAELEPHLQNALRGYGIGPEEWQLLRTAGTLEANGHKYLTPQAGHQIDATAAEALLRARGRKAGGALSLASPAGRRARRAYHAVARPLWSASVAPLR